MYHYFEDKEFLSRMRVICGEMLQKLVSKLSKEYGMRAQFYMVGSGARNVVTQNSNEPIDLDYNLEILSFDDYHDGKRIKETVRKAFNEVLNEYSLNDCEDSTSCLSTDYIHFTDIDSYTQFSIDLAIVIKLDDGKWSRLIHQKTGFVSSDTWAWNEAPNSKNLESKVERLKKNGLWMKVRDTYLDKKNLYLRRNDNSHPSFICYIEAVNEVYSKSR